MRTENDRADGRAHEPAADADTDDHLGEGDELAGRPGSRISKGVDQGADDHRPDQEVQRDTKHLGAEIADHAAGEKDGAALEGQVLDRPESGGSRGDVVVKDTEPERDHHDRQQDADAVHQRDRPFVAAHRVSENDHLRETARRCRAEGIGGVEGYQPAQRPAENQDGQDGIESERAQAENPVACLLEDIGCEGAADHEADDGDHVRAEAAGAAQRGAGQGRRRGRAHGAHHPGQRHAGEQEQIAAEGAKADGENDGKDLPQALLPDGRGGTACVVAHGTNCSLMMRSSRLCSGSNRMVGATVPLTATLTRTASRTSAKSAPARTRRCSGSITSKVTTARCGRSAPRQRRGRKALIGVIARSSAPQRQDRAVYGIVVGRAAGRRRNQDAVADHFLHPQDAVDEDADLGGKARCRAARPPR